MINYEGVNYNLDVIIQFQALKQLLEALAKKQIDHNILLYGLNKNIIVNSNDNIPDEDNINEDNKKEDDSNKENNIIDNDNKNLAENINNLGLINAFIESQKQLIKHKKLIDELTSRIEALEKEKEIQSNKDIDNKEDISHIKDEHSINEMNENKNKDKENVNDDKKDNNIVTNDLNNNYNETNNNVSKDNIMVDTENKIIKNYDIKEENFIKSQMTTFEDNFKLLNQHIEKIQNQTETNKKSIDSSKNEISQFKVLIKKISDETKINKMKKEEEQKKKLEKSHKKEKDNSFEDFENKIIKLIEDKFKDFSILKADNINIKKELKELNEEKEKLKQEHETIFSEIKNIKDKNTEIVKQMMNFPDMSAITKIEEKLKMIELEMEEFGTKKDVKYICGEIDKYEKSLSKLKSFIVSQEEINEKNKDEMVKLKNLFETLKKTFSAVNRLFENNSLSALLGNLNDLSQKLVDKEEYNKFIKDINRTISDIKMDVNEHNRSLDEIMPLIRKILTMEDLNKLENSLTGLIEKQNADAKGKYADKKEIIKSIKSIESQVKIFMKNLDKEREKEKNESAILASKPVGGYKCASCEAYIGELKESYTYLPWNKYHGAERPYRLGSSFSRILQGLNLENTFNPFIHKNFLNENKKNQLANNCLSVKKVRKVAPLTHITSENEMIKNLTIEEPFSTDVSNSNKRYQNKINLWGSKTLRKNVNDVNSWNKSKNKDNSFTKKLQKRGVEKTFKVSRKVVRSKVNTSEDLENHYYIPNL